MKDKKVDMLAVAIAAGVSISTVSRSFNHPEMVKGPTRKKIDEVVRKLGYIRNRAAQTIHGIRSGTIGLIVPTVDHAIFAELIQSFAEEVEKLGFTILLASHGYDLQREYALTRKMLEHRVDGIALVGTEHAGETASLLNSQKTPTILLWNFIKSSAFPCVGSDNFLAGHLVGEHVVSLGHQKIAAFFPPTPGNDRAADRLRGFYAALNAHDMRVPCQWKLEAPYSVSAAKKIITRLLETSERPSAIVCGNDVLAWGVLHAAAKTGIDVSRALTVTGIGDFKGSVDFEPALTTVRIPARQIGRKSARLIAHKIISPEDSHSGESILPELVVRNTSAPPG